MTTLGPQSNLWLRPLVRTICLSDWSSRARIAAIRERAWLTLYSPLFDAQRLLWPFCGLLRRLVDLWVTRNFLEAHR